jgi:hypothetical protein
MRTYLHSARRRIGLVVVSHALVLFLPKAELSRLDQLSVIQVSTVFFNK